LEGGRAGVGAVTAIGLMVGGGTLVLALFVAVDVREMRDVALLERSTLVPLSFLSFFVVIAEDAAGVLLPPLVEGVAPPAVEEEVEPRRLPVAAATVVFVDDKGRFSCS